MNNLRFALLALFAATGCSAQRPVADVERGKQAVAAALDSWKAGRAPGNLQSASDQVEFVEELRTIFKLTDYEFGRVDASGHDVIRYAVTLKLRDRKGKTTSREVVYAVALKSPIAVSRDPYF